ncbi:MAG: response regulator transcription factor [Polaromonas sp.]|nr:response regulator transcription factor [Polaromonas sp.]
MKIIVVEDQVDLQDELVYFLGKSGHEACGVSNGIELDQSMARQQPDLLLLDICLPGEDGIAIAQRLRDTPGMVIVMLTARSTEEDRIRSFESGADNYLVKPVNYRELQAILERANQRLNRTTWEVPALWQLQRRERMLISPTGQEVPLTGMELCLLETMMAGNLSKVTSRRVLVESMGYDYLTFDERRLEVRISRLRKKIRDITGSDDPVKSEWGAGYIFLAPCALN